MREIKADEAHKLYECLESMGEHHNKVSVYFKGHYPTITSKQLIEDFIRELNEGKGYIAVAEEDGNIAGFCEITTEGKEGVLDYLAVLEDRRGKGYGKNLIEWSFEKFRELGVENIEVKVVYGNGVIELYKKYGFREKSIILRTSIKDQDELLNNR